MKFMKLGSRPDTFYTTESVRSVSSEVSSDFIIQVENSRYLLHKFPLLSKSLRLQKLCSENSESHHHQIVQLPDFPGGVEAFELCAKFCYGITITVSAHNIVPLRCAAEYLQMTEDVEKGNLIYKLEVFFNSCILRGWKDSIITLQSTKLFHSWSEELGITSRCIESISWKVLANPLKISLSNSHSRRVRDDLPCNGRKLLATKGWWAEDLAELGIDLFWRTMIAIKTGGKVPTNLVGDALKIYASRWLPNIPKDAYGKKEIKSDTDWEFPKNASSKYRLVLESIISLLPCDRVSVSCSFLFKLLKVAYVLNASSSSKMELARRIGLQLDEAKASDLLIPSMSCKNDMIYDVDIVITILEHFMLQRQSPPISPTRARNGFERRRRSRSAENINFELNESRRSSSVSHSSRVKVAKLVDLYLQEIARDVNLPLSKFIELAEGVPEFARLDHDDLYRAIDIYLKAHPDLTKSERKRLCRTLNCKKLSMEVCMHAAQNDLLPLRLVVQVLFFEQARAATTGGHVTSLPSNIKALLSSNSSLRAPNLTTSSSTTTQVEDQWSVTGVRSPKLKLETLKMKLAEDDDSDMNFIDVIEKHNKVKLRCMMPARPKKMFGKLWSSNRSTNDKN